MEKGHLSCVVCSVTHSCLSLCNLMDCSMPGFPFPGICSNSCSLSPWCHQTISSSVVPFSSCLQSHPASRSFPVSRFFTSGSQSILELHISPSIEYSRLISFRIDWFDLSFWTFQRVVWGLFLFLSFLLLVPPLSPVILPRALLKSSSDY